MNKTAVALIAASLAVVGSASAAERAPAHAPICITLDKLKADIKGVKGAKLMPLNPGQLHYMWGVYSGTAPVGPHPDADSAVLVELGGKSMVIWMNGKPSCQAKQPPMAIPNQMAAEIKTINPSPGETVDGDDSSEDRSL